MSDWVSKLEIHMDNIFAGIKNKKEAELFHISAKRRLQAIMPLHVLPLKTFIENEYLKKIPQEILGNIRKFREAAQQFPLSTDPELIEVINNHLDNAELRLYENVIEWKDRQKIINEIIENSRKLGIVFINIDKIAAYDKEEKEVSIEDKKEGLIQFRKSYLELLRKEVEKRPKALQRPIGENLLKAKTKKGQEHIHSWRIVGSVIWDLYMLLLPLYSVSVNKKTSEIKAKYQRYPEKLLQIICEILKSQIHVLEKLTPEDVKSRIRYRIHDLLKDISAKELLRLSISIFKNFDKKGFDDAILYPLIQEADYSLRKELLKPLTVNKLLKKG